MIDRAYISEWRPEMKVANVRHINATCAIIEHDGLVLAAQRSAQ